MNQYTYDSLNRITRIQQQGTAVPKRFDFTYDAASQFATLARYQNLSGTAAVVTSKKKRGQVPICWVSAQVR